MINWQPIETAPDAQVMLYVPPHKLRDAVVFVGRVAECAKSATHWAPINLPGEEVRMCDNCDAGAVGLACGACENHSKWRHK